MPLNIEDATFEKMEFLLGSPTRVEILDTLAEDGQLDGRDLRERTDTPKSTLQRNLRKLEGNAWVRRVDGEYELTALGEAILDDLGAVVDTMRLDSKLAPFLRWVPPEVLDIDLHLLADADVTVSTPSDPYAPVDRHVESLETTGEYRGLLPSVSRRAMEVGRRRITEPGRTVIVLERAVAETLRADSDAKRTLDEVVEAEGTDVFVHDGRLPFYLGLVDGTVQLGAEDPSGMQRALVEAGDPDVVAWAEDVFETFKDDSSRITPGRGTDASANAPLSQDSSG